MDILGFVGREKALFINDIANNENKLRNTIEKSTFLTEQTKRHSFIASLLNILETLHISSDINKIDARFAVQTVLRPQREGFLDYRGYAGRLSSGIYRIGDEITVLPSGFNSKIKTINAGETEINEAYAPMSISMTLEDDIDISRGDMIVKKNNQPQVSQEFDVMLCWFNDESAKPRGKYLIKHTSNEQRAMIKEVVYKMDINSFKRNIDNKK